MEIFSFSLSESKSLLPRRIKRLNKPKPRRFFSFLSDWATDVSTGGGSATEVGAVAFSSSLSSATKASVATLSAMSTFEGSSDVGGISTGGSGAGAGVGGGGFSCSFFPRRKSPNKPPRFFFSSFSVDFPPSAKAASLDCVGSDVAVCPDAAGIAGGSINSGSSSVGIVGGGIPWKESSSSSLSEVSSSSSSSSSEVSFSSSSSTGSDCGVSVWSAFTG